MCSRLMVIAIQSVTIANAMILHMDKKWLHRSRVFSKSIATNNDLKQNVSKVTDVVFEMKEGVVYKRDWV